MGIPTFTRKLLQQHKSISSETTPDVDSLYIDFNGEIYGAVHKALTELPETASSLEIKKKIFKECWASFEELVETANPSKLIYIAIDGVAPRAKMHQQRLRRFKIKDKSRFDTNCITPGTKFMHELTEYMKKECQRCFKDKSFKVTFSHYHYAGEGEHKILAYLRYSEKTKQETSCIVGLDADLIMLMLALPHKNIYIMRGEQDNDLKKAYGDIHYISIDTLKQLFQDSIDQELTVEVELQRVIQDYILLCFFGGNDFLPHLPSTEIRFDGINKLLELYWAHLNNENGYLTNESTINWPSFIDFMTELSLHEEDLIQYTGRQMKKWKPKQNFPDEETKQKYLEELLYPVYDPVNFSSPGWWVRYYQHCFYMKYVDKVEVKEICFEYLKTLEWNFAYYMKGCPDWEHYYPYSFAPFVKDLVFALKFYKPTVFKDNQACSPFEQLMLVLPPSSKGLLPRSINRLMEDQQLLPYYPEYVEPDMMFCNMTWQCKPKLPLLNYELIQKRVVQLFPKLSDAQKKMNSVKQET